MSIKYFSFRIFSSLDMVKHGKNDSQILASIIMEQYTILFYFAPRLDPELV